MRGETRTRGQTRGHRGRCSHVGTAAGVQSPSGPAMGHHRPAFSLDAVNRTLNLVRRTARRSLSASVSLPRLDHRRCDRGRPVAEFGHGSSTDRGHDDGRSARCGGPACCAPQAPTGAHLSTAVRDRTGGTGGTGGGTRADRVDTRARVGPKLRAATAATRHSTGSQDRGSSPEPPDAEGLLIAGARMSPAARRTHQDPSESDMARSTRMLSVREEVIALLAHGRTLAQTADALGITYGAARWRSDRAGIALPEGHHHRPPGQPRHRHRRPRTRPRLDHRHRHHHPPHRPP
jgi:hypothetical protein